MASHTAVVMVNWNGAAFLDPLLQSVQSCSPAEMIVIDNRSGDDSARVLERYTSLTTVFNPVNLGFGSAANQGIQMAKAPFVLILNVDLEARPGSIDILEQYMLSHPEVAVAAPQLLFPDGSLQTSLRSFPTPIRLFLYLSFLDRIFPSHYRLSAEEHRESMDMEQPMGAALLLRKSALEQTGSFDPQFFMYMEDVDLCERLKGAGWKLAYVPAAQMVHLAGGSSNQDWERTQRNYLESVLRYFHKRSTPAGLLSLRAALTAALFLRSVVLVALGRLRQSWFYVRAALRMPFLRAR